HHDGFQICRRRQRAAVRRRSEEAAAGIGRLEDGGQIQGRGGFLVFSGMLAVQQITQVTAIAQDQKFTCQVYGGSSVLDDSDFQALASQQITREKFASFAPRSKGRIEVCDTRKLWRVIKSGNATRC